ncbi:PIN domain-containing protein [Candidatus Woesearchaeota archaeon]|nr:PIN domain-containing protein [Candidatus Woesearchaeota archaeon]
MRHGLESSPALIDTNVLVYAYAEDSQKRQEAVRLMADCFSGKTSLAVSLQNVGEFSDVALNKFGLEYRQVRETVEELLASNAIQILAYGSTTIFRALEISEKHKVHFWDALLASTVLENGLTVIYTEDAAFSRIEGIRAINPFRKP